MTLHDPTNEFLPTKMTPNWQLVWGRGRGAQFYPTVSACVHRRMPNIQTQRLAILR